MFVRALRAAVLLTMFAVAFVWSASAFAAPAATFTVNATDDTNDGQCNTSHCSLREAIIASNASGGVKDTLRFKIKVAGNLNCDSGTKVCVIDIASELPTITDPVIIDGYTQNGASPNTLTRGNDAQIKIVIDGNLNFFEGLTLAAGNSLVKGLSIVRFNDSAIYVTSNVNEIGGNWIGLAPDGSQQANARGVELLNAFTNLIGGGTAASRNVISGNNGAGITLVNSNTNLVQGNYIGTNAQGLTDRGNGGDGVSLLGSDFNTIGGTGELARNVISGNGGDGVYLQSGADSNLIANNLIGVGSNRKAKIGNDNGIFFTGAFSQPGAKNNTVSRNRIANNASAGIWVQDVTNDYSTGNTFTANSIFSNGALGIDLRAPGVTGNDNGDGDTGENTLQNFPVLDSAKVTATGATIKGTFNSTANTAFQLEFFASPTCDGSGNGEGKKFLGSLNVTTDGSGNAAFTFKTTKFPKVGQHATATATRTNNADMLSTSEFSACRTIQ